ncbi:dioxygenase [Staphylococcus aureus]|uniref:Dioxygenase n=1 Tax=Staphylococcus aureus TaxID=1280 RepID=A0A380DZK7_STAAU|nr:dioxygenase [Staphylococcus aureus]
MMQNVIIKFFTEVLGMRLVKKTVNQDDIYTYHTFFADDVGSAGTDMTFFDFPNITKGQQEQIPLQDRLLECLTMTR